LKNIIRNEFRIIIEFIFIYIYIHIAPHSNCDEKEPGGAVLKGEGELRINLDIKDLPLRSC
jgi:hypothetical protein